MDEKEKTETLDLNTRVPTLNHSGFFTLAQIQALYVFTTDPVPKFSERYHLSPILVTRFVKEGRWDELRQEHTAKALEVFNHAVAGTNEDSLDIEVKLQNLRNIQLEQQVQELAKYFTVHGHLFAVDERNGEIMKDAYGFPLPVKIPSGTKAALDLIDALHTRIKTLRKSAEDGKYDKARPVDVSDFPHLFKPAASKKPNEQP